MFLTVMNFLKMSFYKGATRFVVVFPKLNIVLKIAHIHPLRALRVFVSTAHDAIRNGGWSEFKRRISYEDGVYHSFLWQFRGIYCNLREYRFFRETRNPFLWPTTFSLYGIVNIQPFAEKQPIENAGLT